MGLFRRSQKIQQPKVKPRPPCTPADMPGSPALVRLEGAAKQALDASRGRLVIGIGLFYQRILVKKNGEPELTDSQEPAS